MRVYQFRHVGIVTATANIISAMSPALKSTGYFVTTEADTISGFPVFR
jgi:hypothetical protein